MGRCFLQAPLTHGVPLVLRGGPRVVFTSGGLTQGVLVSRWGHAEHNANVTPDGLCSSVGQAHGVAEKDKKYEKD